MQNSILCPKTKTGKLHFNITYTTCIFPDNITCCNYLTQTCTCISLTHCGLVMPYGYKDLGQHCLWQWFVAWRHHAITLNNVDFSSVRFCGIPLRVISHKVPELIFNMMGLKIILLNLLSHLPGANESKPKITYAQSKYQSLTNMN